MANEVMLTTKDNPYNPFEQFDEWYLFDELSGYHTCGLLDRFANVNDEMSESDKSLMIDIAIEEIVSLEPEIYKKVERTQI